MGSSYVLVEIKIGQNHGYEQTHFTLIFFFRFNTLNVDYFITYKISVLSSPVRVHETEFRSASSLLRAFTKWNYGGDSPRPRTANMEPG